MYFCLLVVGTIANISPLLKLFIFSFTIKSSISKNSSPILIDRGLVLMTFPITTADELLLFCCFIIFMIPLYGLLIHIILSCKNTLSRILSLLKVSPFIHSISWNLTRSVNEEKSKIFSSLDDLDKSEIIKINTLY